MRIPLAVLAALALAVAAPALASERHPTLAELEGELICPTCNPMTLDQSNAPVADQMRAFIRRRIAAGDTKSEIKDKLVAKFGRGVLASPPTSGFDLLAWLLPLLGVAAAALGVGIAAWRWSRDRDTAETAASPSSNGRLRVEPELERRLDEELARFD